MLWCLLSLPCLQKLRREVLCMTLLIDAIGCWLTECKRSFCVQLVLLVLALVIPIVRHTQNPYIRVDYISPPVLGSMAWSGLFGFSSLKSSCFGSLCGSMHPTWPSHLSRCPLSRSGMDCCIPNMEARLSVVSRSCHCLYLDIPNMVRMHWVWKVFKHLFCGKCPRFRSI